MPDDNSSPDRSQQGQTESSTAPGAGAGVTVGFVAGPRYAPLLEPVGETAAETLPAAEAASPALGPIAGALGAAGAGLAAAGGVALAGESIRAASAGEKTPIEIADDYYHTHFGDLWGWMKGDYAQQTAAKDKQRQLQQATTDSIDTFTDTPVNSSSEQCPANKAVTLPGTDEEPLSQEDQRQVEYENYKARCNQPPPPGLDPCAAARWKLDRNRDCRNLRQAWDDKWMPGRHQNDIDNLDRSINNLEEWIRRNCE